MSDGIKISVEHSINWQRIEDLFVCAFEGGSNYWYTIVKHNKKEINAQFLSTLPAKEGGWVEVMDNEGELKKAVRVDRSVAEKGLKIMAEKYPKHFTDFINENDDADTGDVFLQCCVFGNVIFG
jgi:hypothetical protein